MRIRDSVHSSSLLHAAAAAAARGDGPSSNGPKRSLVPAAPPSAPPTPPTPQPQDAERTAPALAPGFRFHPTDEELVSYYLKRKIFSIAVRFNAIAEVDIYKHEPWNLSEFSKLKSRDQEWYFYSALDKKYGNGGRMNRATGRGYWKATGKDREVRREAHLLGMKKTLVYHTGRAPDGQRTNWVMHEYRLVEDEFERYSTGQDAYVLCRIFHKNNIGPPSGNRYAPFVEEEWDDGRQTVVPGLDAMDEAPPPSADVDNNRNNSDQETRTPHKVPFSLNDEPPSETQDLLPPSETQDLLPPSETQDLLPLCKRETGEDTANPVCILNTQAPFPLLQYKRRRHNDAGPSRSNNSGSSARTTQDLCSSTTTETAHATAADTTTAISALLEFSLMEPLEPKMRAPPSPPPRPISHLDAAIPPSIVKLISDLQKEVHKVSVERETMKLELMSAHAMLNVLQSRIDFMSAEKREVEEDCP